MTAQRPDGGGTILIVGEALIDAHLASGVLTTHPGGGPFNTAIALARLGAPSFFVGALSRDRLGRELEARLKSAGVDLRGIEHVDEPTPLAVVATENGEAHYSFYLAGTAHERLRLDHVDSLVEHAAALHVGTLALATDPPAAALRRFAGKAAAKLLLAVDPNVRPALISDRDAYVRRFEQLAAVAELVKLSRGDLDWLYPGAGETAAADRLLASGAACVVVTAGAAGAAGWTAVSSARVAAPRVEVVDTVGAGDAFGAGLLAWLWRANRLRKGELARLAPEQLEACLAYAAAAGAVQCTRASAWGPSSDDVERLGDRHRRTSQRKEEVWQSSSSTG